MKNILIDLTNNGNCNHTDTHAFIIKFNMQLSTNINIFFQEQTLQNNIININDRSTMCIYSTTIQLSNLGCHSHS